MINFDDINLLPKSAKEAKLLGKKYYFTNKPCKRGHISVRRVANSKCLECDRINRQKYRNQHKEKCNKQTREWYKKNKDYALDYAKKYTSQLDVRCKRSLYQIKYSNGHECANSVEDLISDFTGKCFICGISEIDCNKKLCVDHCHDTLKFRGWLCDNCNTGLARFKDNIDILRKAIDYLVNSSFKKEI